MSVIEFAFPLPARYRRREVFAFHARDPEALTESVQGDRIRKGVIVGGAPTVIDLELQGRHVSCRVDVDQPADVRRPLGGDHPAGIRAKPRAAGKNQAAADSEAVLRMAVFGMLGLHADPAPFEAAWRDDALFGPIVGRQRGLRVPLSFSAFEALSWAVIGQQINLAFAIQLRRAVVRSAGRRHSSGLWCYPEAADVARLRPSDLCALKFSRAKAETLVRVAQLTVDGALPLERWRSAAAGLETAAADLKSTAGVDQGLVIEEMERTLLAVKGIGPWTVNYVLLRGFGLVDRSLHGDAAVRAALQRVLGLSERLDESRARLLLERYRPWRSLAAAHLWASLHAAP
jgi:DNA-3-methyladenine glycosylase II